MFVLGLRIRLRLSLSYDRISCSFYMNLTRLLCIDGMHHEPAEEQRGQGSLLFLSHCLTPPPSLIIFLTSISSVCYCSLSFF